MGLLVSMAEGLDVGEELTISYGPIASVLPRAQRRQALSEQYGFACMCSACNNCRSEDYSWRERAEALDVRAQEAASSGNWRAAVVASQAALSYLTKGYAAGDLELAREQCKLAGLLLRAGDT